MFKEDSLLQRFFYQWGQLIALNLLWIATSLLLVTIGASTTALYHCCLKWRKDKDVAVLRTYWKAFRENFSQATLGWLSLSAITLLLWLEQRFLRSMSGTAALVFGYAQWMVVLSLLILTTYLFPVIAAFRNRLSTLLGHSFYFFFKRPHIGLVNLLLIILPIWVTLNVFPDWPIFNPVCTGVCFVPIWEVHQKLSVPSMNLINMYSNHSGRKRYGTCHADRHQRAYPCRPGC